VPAKGKSIQSAKQEKALIGRRAAKALLASWAAAKSLRPQFFIRTSYWLIAKTSQVFGRAMDKGFASPIFVIDVVVAAASALRCA